MASIEYFYSAHSAFAYLGSRRFMEIAAAAGRRIEHKPVHLTPVIAGVGSTPTAERSQRHRAYYFRREIERWSELRGAPVVTGIPTHHYNDMTLSNCVLIAADAAGINVDEMAHLFLEAHWRDDADLADTKTLTALIERAGHDAATLLTGAGAPKTLARYEANTQEAIERSVFGSPTYFVDGDMFYGQDHLDMVERALKTPFAGTWP